MDIHKNARSTPYSRRLMVRRVLEEQRPASAVALEFGVDVSTVHKWLRRYRAGGEPALQDRSSAPTRCPHRLPPETVAAIEHLRRQYRTGPQIATRLGLPRSTVGIVLRRLGLNRLARLEPKPPVVRYERERPGELVHIDTKKLGRIDGLGHRVTGDRTDRKRGTGWEYLHVCIDDASRLAYTEILPAENAIACTGFLKRAIGWFDSHGVRIERVMTDNAWAYVNGKAWHAELAAIGAQHKRTKPYRPRTNGKAERFIQTALREWLYATGYQTSQQRTADMHPWLHFYNHHRPHAGIGALPPISRLPMDNLLGNDT